MVKTVISQTFFLLCKLTSLIFAKKKKNEKTLFTVTMHILSGRGRFLCCGKTIDRTFSHELTPDELLFWADFYETVFCEEITPAVDPLP